ncbi:hypothetical protein [Tahibacter soli]|uniref:Uncharacterized protein n=1 Tax=Tahibacter soli TaxID=2983605 RepID=A0A9X3YI33_9GAMM|nr:hypothetical protein [Tahibacter soli]MDC8011431.1 hypothetical protein [Tahibacter soli]
MQRVEQEVRLQLRLEHLQPRLREFRREPARFDVATRLLGLVVQRLPDRQQRPVCQKARRDVLRDEVAQLQRKTAGLEQRRDERAGGDRDHGHAGARDRVHRVRAPARRRGDRPALGEAKHQRREAGPRAPLDRRPAQVDDRRPCVGEQQIVDPALQREDDDDRRPQRDVARQADFDAAETNVHRRHRRGRVRR